MENTDQNTEKRDQFASGDLFAVSNEPVQENVLPEAVPLDHLEQAKPLDQAENVKSLDSIVPAVPSHLSSAEQGQPDFVPIKEPDKDLSSANVENAPEILHEPMEEAKPLPPAPASVPVSASVSAPVSVPASAETEQKTEKVPPPRKISLPQSANLTSLGAFLSAARNAAGMTVEQVAEHTLIRMEYIRALEEDDLKRLPPIIFIKAYIRSLRDFYNLDDTACTELEQLQKELQELADVPEKVIDELNKNVQINEEEAKKVRRTGYYLLSALGFLLLLIICLVVYFSVTRAKTDPVGTSVPAEPIAAEVRKDVKSENRVFQPEDLDKLIPPVIPEERVMAIPADKKRRR